MIKMALCGNYEVDYEKQIKNLEEKPAVNYEDFHQDVSLWRSNNLTAMMPLDEARKKELALQISVEECSAETMNHNKDYNAEQEAKIGQLKELEQNESHLRTELENIATQIQKLKDENKNTRKKKKLEMYRNCAKISKKLTGTNFDYQGPNVSGFLSSKGNLHVIDLNPTKLSEDEVANYLWGCIKTKAAADWSDVFNINLE